jgi:hypothetical protein
MNGTKEDVMVFFYTLLLYFSIYVMTEIDWALEREPSKYLMNSIEQFSLYYADKLLFSAKEGWAWGFIDFFWLIELLISVTAENSNEFSLTTFLSWFRVN